MRRKRAAIVQKTMYVVVVIMKMKTTIVAETRIDAVRLAVMSAEVTMKDNVKKSLNQNPNPNLYLNVELMLKSQELFLIWAKISILSSCQISYRLKLAHLTHRHTKMKSMKKKQLTKKVDKGNIKLSFHISFWNAASKRD